MTIEIVDMTDFRLLFFLQLLEWYVYFCQININLYNMNLILIIV